MTKNKSVIIVEGNKTTTIVGGTKAVVTPTSIKLTV